MNELTILENGIVPVYTTDKGERVVDGRELWAELKSNTDFSSWVKRRLDECGALENKDFSVFAKSGENLEGGRPTKEYTIKLSIAKEMAMLERNEIGKKVRKYFIAVEEKHMTQAINTAELSPQMRLLTEMVNGMAQQELKIKQQDISIKQLEQKQSETAEALENFKGIVINRDDDFRAWANDTIRKAAMNTPDKDYQGMWSWAYEELDRRARSDINERLRNLHKRLTAQGATKTQIKNTTKIDVIAADARLKEIFTAIVKELAIRYDVRPNTQVQVPLRAGIDYFSSIPS